MKTAAEYRQRAAVALDKEAFCADPELRAQWFEIARSWILLADSALAQETLARSLRLGPDGA